MSASVLKNLNYFQLATRIDFSNKRFKQSSALSSSFFTSFSNFKISLVSSNLLEPPFEKSGIWFNPLLTDSMS